MPGLTRAARLHPSRGESSIASGQSRRESRPRE
jgi:hypothetical protein